MLRHGKTGGGNVAAVVDACINLELSQPAEVVDPAAIRLLFEHATSDRAVRASPSIWLRWIALEESWGELERASNLYFRAMHLVDDTDQFVSMHSMQHCGKEMR